MALAKTVKEIMTRSVLVMTAEQTLLEAMLFMRENSVRHIPIVQGAQLVGIVTDRDIKRATPSALLNDREATRKTMEETPLMMVMAGTPISVGSDASLKVVLRLLVDEKIGCLPIVDAGSLVGIVTAHDMLRVLLDTLD